MKRLLVLLIMSIAVIAIPLSAAEEKPETFTSGDWTYTLQEDGTICISQYTGQDTVVAVPYELDGKTVTGIRTGGSTAFSGNKTIQTITIPDSITNINSNPFVRCDNLTKILVSPDHPYLAVIDGVLFSKPDKRLICYPMAFSADSYEVPQGIRVIGIYAFADCNALSDITIPDSVTSIESSAFCGCKYLESITIPESVSSIGTQAFLGCRTLKSIAVPDSVMSIGKGAFSLCDALTSVKLPNGLTEIETRLFENCKSLETINMPDGVTSIGKNAFWGCESLITITIPDSVTSIDEGAFVLCKSLTSVTIPDSVTNIGYRAFQGCSSLTSITIPQSVTSMGEIIFRGCNSVTVIVLRDSFAKQYCELNGIRYTYPDANDWLNN